jgi:NitT/TauT family transport system permease protein
LRILLGWAWTYLIVAEVVGTMSGITYFINQQARYRNFDNVYAAIAMIGIIGFSTDLFLAWLGSVLFPWKRKSRSRSSLWPWIARLWSEPAPIVADSAVPLVENKPAESKPGPELNAAQ